MQPEAGTLRQTTNASAAHPFNAVSHFSAGCADHELPPADSTGEHKHQGFYAYETILRDARAIKDQWERHTAERRAIEERGDGRLQRGGHFLVMGMNH